MTGKLRKDAKDFSPYCDDQGIPCLVGTDKPGISIQYVQFVMVAGGVLDFTDNGLMDMANTSYGVFVHNHTDVADEATVANADRAVNQITITGPDNNDVLDVMIVGALSGQLVDA